MTARRVAVGLVLLLAATYGAAPWLANALVPMLLTRWGIDESRFEFGYPRWNWIDVAHFSLRSDGTSVAGHRTQIVYRLPQLVRGELESVVIETLTVQLERGSGTYTPVTGSIEPPPIWSLIPAQRVSVVKLVVESADPVFAARGSVNFDPELLQLRLDVESPLLAVPLLVNGAINADGRVALTLLERDATAPIVSLVGVPDADRRAMTLDGRIELSGRPLAFAAAYAKANIESGSALVEMRGRAAWPLPTQAPWKALTLDGKYRVEFVGSTPTVSRAQARVGGNFSFANDALEVRVDPGSELAVDVPELRRLGPGKGLDERVSLTTDQTVRVDYSPKEMRLGDGLVVTAGAPSNPIQFRLRGAVAADRHFEVGVVSLDGTPIILATGVPDDADNLAIKSRIALSGRVLHASGASIGLTTTGGRVLADFDGVVQWPLVPERGLSNLSGKGRAELAVTGRFEKRAFDIALQGSYEIGDGPIRATLDSGAHVILPSDGIEVSTISALALDAQPDGSHVAFGPVDFKLALPPMPLGKRTFTLDNAWVALEKLVLDGDAVSAAAIVRTHSSRDALPVRVTLSHDLASQRGKYSIVGDWQIKKAVLATQLPGLRAPYDLDAGTLALALNGSWDLSSGPSHRGSGHVRVKGERAHYEDYLVSGIAVNLPVNFDTQTYGVEATTMTFDEIDVGFPLRGVTVDMSVADGIARLRNLGGAVLGGRFAANEFGYDIAQDQASLEVALAGISLAEVLALEGGHVQGNGILDGKLPITIDGEVFTVDTGTIAARPPGGTLVYKGAAASAMVAQSGFGFAFKALEDFRYNTLDANVVLAADGALTLAVRLRGTNPAVENGRAIAFNLNVNENLPALLESLRAAERITDQVEQRYVPRM